MISLSTVSVIIFVPLTIIILVLFIVCFLKNRKIHHRLQAAMAAKNKIKQAFDNQNKEYQNLKLELKNVDKTAVFSELVNEDQPTTDKITKNRAS